MAQDTPTSPNFQRGVSFCGWAALLIGAFWLISWAMGYTSRWAAEGTITVKSNMALSQVLGGVALLLLGRRRAGPKHRFIGQLAAGAILLIGALTLSEHLIGWNLHIDQILFRESPGAPATVSPNRMGLPGSLTLALLGVGLLALHSKKPRFASYVGIAVGAISLIPAVGLVYGIEQLHAWPRLTAIAWPSLVALIALSCGLILARRDDSFLGILLRDDPGGILLRRLLPAMVFIPLVLGFATVWGERRGIFGTATGTGMLVIALVLVFSMLLWRSAAHLSRSASARRHAEEELRRQAALIDLSPDAIIVRGIDGSIKFWSKGAEKLYGWTKEEALNQNTDVLLQTEFPEPFQDIIDHVRGGRDWVGELIHTTKTGGEVTVQSFWHAENIDAEFELLESNVDITESKRAREDMESSEKKFRAVFEQAGVGMGRVNFSDARWIDVNDTFCRMLGYGPEELKSIPWPEMTHPDDLELDLIPFRQMAAGELDSYSVEKRFRHKLGRYVWARLTLSLVRDARGRPDYEVAIIEDITIRRRLEDDLRAAVISAERSKASAEQASQAKDQFLAVLSHELRTPLTPVLAAISLLRKRGDLPAPIRDRLEMIHRNVSIEARLIDDLLDLTRIVRGKVSLEKSEVNICEVLDRVVETCRPQIDAKRIHFGLQSGDEPLEVSADSSRLQQVFWNLLNNSIKFTGEGGCIGFRAFRQEDSIVVEVSDSGIGIEQEALPKIFDAFEQGGAAVTRQFGGLGLGLAITKRLVEMHGGHIFAESAGKDKGTLFRVSIPQAERKQKMQAAFEVGGTHPPQKILSRRILLVEDHADTALLMRELLDSAGYEVETASDVAQSLQKAEHQRFDLVISDLGLPDRSGLELMKELRQRKIGLRGIALSGYGREEDVRRSKEAGFSEHLTKPVDFDALLAAVERVAS